MYYIEIGTDTYGRVKAVGGTTIVTKFAMVNSLPLYPLASYYSFGKPKKNSQGVPLTRLDRASVAMAYLRGVFGTLAIFGSIICFFCLVYWLNGGVQFDTFARYMTLFLITCLLIGIVGGGLTYTIPLISHRDKAIRECCRPIIGMSLDPALIRLEFVQAVENFVEEMNPTYNAADYPNFVCEDHFKLAMELLRLRIEIGFGNSDGTLEQRTDELLDRMSRSMVTA